MKKEKIYRNKCPKCGGDVTVDRYSDTGVELFCVTCGNRKDFIDLNNLINVRDTLEKRIKYGIIE